ncbi:hypothetical protein BDR03DRAFT_101324 [Suillus americanus]|nr:hypothetical protein BDR03DRAFT_101324 [Suillus americanus]
MLQLSLWICQLWASSKKYTKCTWVGRSNLVIVDVNPRLHRFINIPSFHPHGFLLSHAVCGVGYLAHVARRQRHSWEECSRLNDRVKVWDSGVQKTLTGI